MVLSYEFYHHHTKHILMWILISGQLVLWIICLLYEPREVTLEWSIQAIAAQCR